MPLYVHATWMKLAAAIVRAVLCCLFDTSNLPRGIQLKRACNDDVTRSGPQVHESNVGDQPQWLFDAVNSFLDAD